MKFEILFYTKSGFQKLISPSKKSEKKSLKIFASLNLFL